ncbi:MAG: hypothetical protein ABJA74_16470 [Lapillicoccus sp.]
MALTVLGAIGLVFAILNKIRTPESSPSLWVGIAFAIVIVGGFGGWFLVHKSSFLFAAHYSSAVPLFAMLASGSAGQCETFRARGRNRCSSAGRRTDGGT